MRPKVALTPTDHQRDARRAKLSEGLLRQRGRAGELLGEHDRVGHGHHVWEALTHVPFIVSRGGTVPETLSTAALPDIVTSSLGLSGPWDVTRTDALPLVSQREGKLAVAST